MELKKIKFNQIAKEEISRNQMYSLVGGINKEKDDDKDKCDGIVVYPTCSCACAYCDQGGSSTAQNGSANHAGGLHSC
jgi:natural product precursor